MKKQLSGKVKNFKKILLRSVALCGLLVLMQAGKSMAQVYARVEYENVTFQSTLNETDNTAYAYVRFYSDAACTIPVTLTQDMTVYFGYDYTGTGGPSSTIYSVQCYQGDSEELLADGGIIDEWDYLDSDNTELSSEEHYRFDIVDDESSEFYYAADSVFL